MSTADESSRSVLLAQIEAFCARPGTSVLYDRQGPTLMDVYSSKTVSIAPRELIRVEERVDAQTGQPYLRLDLASGQLAITAAGIAFAPDFRNSGSVPDLPQAVCFRDFRSILERFKHQVYGHPEQPAGRDAVELLMLCIAILDGARAQGFDVGREEKELEWHLSELEKRR
jgi:hypothetical protein